MLKTKQWSFETVAIKPETYVPCSEQMDVRDNMQAW